MVNVPCCIQKDRLDVVFVVSSVEEMAVEVSCCLDVVSGVAILEPKSVEVAIDETLQYSFWVC